MAASHRRYIAEAGGESIPLAQYVDNDESTPFFTGVMQGGQAKPKSPQLAITYAAAAPLPPFAPGAPAVRARGGEHSPLLPRTSMPHTCAPPSGGRFRLGSVISTVPDYSRSVVRSVFFF